MSTKQTVTKQISLHFNVDKTVGFCASYLLSSVIRAQQKEKEKNLSPGEDLNRRLFGDM